MRRSATFCLLILLSLASAASVGGRGQGRPAGKSPDSCVFSIVGLWRTNANSQTNPILYNFLPNGWVVLEQYSSKDLPQDYQAVSEVKYSVQVETSAEDGVTRPTRLSFIADFGDEVFARGTTSLEIFQNGKDVFSTVDPESGERLEWRRDRAHRRAGAPKEP